MYRKLILLAIAGLLSFGCATVQPGSNLEMKVDTSIEQLNVYRLEDYGIETTDFQKMVGQIILLGDEVVHSEHGRMRTHYANIGLRQKDGSVLELAFGIGKKLDAVGIITVAADPSSEERATWYDVDECGVPELVDTGKGKRALEKMDMDVYAKVIMTLLMKEVYYPSQEGEQT